jgi:hypothetical protein
MGWIISVGQAGAKKQSNGVQVVSICVHMDGQRTLVKVGGRGTDAMTPADSMQARRVWQTVLTTLVGDRH